MYCGLFQINIFKYCKMILFAKSLSQDNYSHVIVGMTPFSFYKVASKIRKSHDNIKIVCDLSDPSLIWS